MADRRALVLVSGLLSELPSGDTVLAGTTSTEIVAGSGLEGGGALGSEPVVDFVIAPNPSGLIFVDEALANDGAARRVADQAIDSGNLALDTSTQALFSGILAVSTANDALASGNAALELISANTGGGSRALFTAAHDMAAGTPVGINIAGEVEAVRQSEISYPQISGVIGSGGFYINATGLINNVLSWKPFDTSDTGKAALYDHRFNDFIYASDETYGVAYIVEDQPNNLTQSIYYESAVLYAGTVDTNYSNVYYNPFHNNNWISCQRASYPAIVPISRVKSKIFQGSSTVVNSSAATYEYAVVLPSGFCAFLASQSSTLYGAALRNTGSSWEKGTYDRMSATDLAPAYITAVYNDRQLSPDGNPLVVAAMKGKNADVYVQEFEFNYQDLEIIPGLTQTVSETPMNYEQLHYMSHNDSYVITGLSGTYPYAITLKRDSNGVFTNVKETVVGDRLNVWDINYDDTNRLFAFVGTNQSNIQCGYFQPSGESFTMMVSGTSNEQTNMSAPRIAYNPTDNTSLEFATGGGTAYVKHMPAMNENFPAYPQNSLNQSNFIGIVADDVSAGSDALVILPGQEVVGQEHGGQVGDPLYLSMHVSGLITSSNKGVTWSGTVPWDAVAQATSSSGYLLLKQL